jgi:hypothetical protein
VQPLRAHLDDLRLAVHGVGDDPGLRARERDRLVPEVADRHRTERIRDPLADGHQHVELACMRPLGDRVGEPHELVRRVAHRGEHPEHAPAGLARRNEPAGDVLYLLRVGDRAAAELHHDEVALEDARVAVGGDLRDRLVLRGRRHA